MTQGREEIQGVGGWKSSNVVISRRCMEGNLWVNKFLGIRGRAGGRERKARKFDYEECREEFCGFLNYFRDCQINGMYHEFH